MLCGCWRSDTEEPLSPEEVAARQKTQEDAAVAALEEIGAKIHRREDGGVVRVQLHAASAGDEATPYLADLPHLEQVYFGGEFASNEKLTDNGLENLAGLKQLERLHLNGTGITDAGVAHLSGLTGLKVLDLSGTQITDAAMPHLTGLVRLKGLFIENTRVTDEGLMQLAGMPSLKVVKAIGSEITVAGVEQFGEVMKDTDVMR